MFLQQNIEEKSEESESTFKAITAQVEALDAELNQILNSFQSYALELPTESNDSVLKSNNDNDLKLLKQLLEAQVEKIAQITESENSIVKKKLAERNVPPSWLFVR